MQRLFTAIFDNRRDADSAIAELQLSGFRSQAIHLATGDPAGASAVSGRAGATGGIANFINTLFGTDDSEYVQKIDGAVTRGHLVLSVAADALEEIERAAAIVERYGPVEIDATPFGEHAGSSAAKASASGPPTQLQAAPPGQPRRRHDPAAHEASWRAHHAATFHAAAFGTDESLTRRALDEAAPAPQAPFPGDEHYDEYAPAYLYGLDMATHEQHGGREWADAEAALRSGWEARHPHSAWAKFREAVRHSWERIVHGKDE